MAHGGSTESPRGTVPSDTVIITPSPSQASCRRASCEGLREGHHHPAPALQRSASAHATSFRGYSADLQSQGPGRDAPHPVRSAPRLTRSATARPASNTVPRRAAPPPPPPPPAGTKSSPPPSTQHRMEHGVEKEAASQRGAAPRVSAGTKHGAHKRGGHAGGDTGAAADMLLEQLEGTGLDNASSREIIQSFVQGQQAAYKGQLEAMDKQACPPTQHPPPLPHLPSCPPSLLPLTLPQVARRCYNRPWAVNMRTDQQHQAGGKRAPSHRQAPVHVQAQGQGRKQAWRKAPTPATGANGTAPAPYRKFQADDRWKTVHSSSYATHPSSAYREIADDVKHSDSAIRHAERVRLTRMNVALTKLEPAEVAMSIAEQSEYSDLFFHRSEKYGHMLTESQYVTKDKFWMQYKPKAQQPGDTRAQWRVAW